MLKSAQIVKQVQVLKSTFIFKLAQIVKPVQIISYTSKFPTAQIFKAASISIFIISSNRQTGPNHQIYLNVQIGSQNRQLKAVQIMKFTSKFPTAKIFQAVQITKAIPMLGTAQIVKQVQVLKSTFMFKLAQIVKPVQIINYPSKFPTAQIFKAASMSIFIISSNRQTGPDREIYLKIPNSPILQRVPNHQIYLNVQIGSPDRQTGAKPQRYLKVPNSPNLRSGIYLNIQISSNRQTGPNRQIYL